MDGKVLLNFSSDQSRGYPVLRYFWMVLLWSVFRLKHPWMFLWNCFVLKNLKFFVFIVFLDFSIKAYIFGIKNIFVNNLIYWCYENSVWPKILYLFWCQLYWLVLYFLSPYWKSFCIWWCVINSKSIYIHVNITFTHKIKRQDIHISQVIWFFSES